MYDIIGDIHGHADKLVLLLEKMGYSLQNGVYTHPSRKVLFLGDYIDRGPEIAKTLSIVQSMVENKQAIALMGNHEYNAICFNTKDQQGEYLRDQNTKNITQHEETLRQFQHNKNEYYNYIEWFKTLPLFFETDGFRAVHACWWEDQIDYLKQELNGSLLTEESLLASSIKDSPMYNAIEDVLKGKEIIPPNGVPFDDKDLIERYEIRIKWWLNPATTTIKALSMLPNDKLPDKFIDTASPGDNWYYKISEKPVFFGHYWFTGIPQIQQENICCLDYSVAKGGELVAYQYKNENILNNEHIVRLNKNIIKAI